MCGIPRYCDRTLQLLLRTFFDIIRLKKGPEHVPDAVLVLVFAIGLFTLAMFVSAVLIESSDSIALSVAASVVGYILYWIVLGPFRRQRRVPGASLGSGPGSRTGATGPGQGGAAPGAA